MELVKRYCQLDDNPTHLTINQSTFSDYHQYANQYHNVIAAGDSIWIGDGKPGIFGEDSGDNTESYGYTGSLHPTHITSITTHRSF